jgi:hypothetical protein
MGLFVPGRKVSPKRFDYEPRYYNPKKEENLRKRLRIQTRTRSNRRSPAGIIYFLLLLGMAVYIYTLMG